MASGIPAGTLYVEVVAELAKLQSDMQRVKSVVGDMSSDVAKKTKVANDNISSISSGISKFKPHQVTNLAYQFQDLGVQMAGAANSEHMLRMGLMALVQQGPQIAMVLREANASVGDLAKQTGSWVVGMARAHPALAALAAAAAVAGGSLAIVTHEMNSERKGEIDAFTKSLGLTKEELEKLGPVGVTVGDVFVGLWNYIKEGLGLDAVFAAIAKWASEAFDTALRWGKNAAAGIYAAFVGTYEGIKAVWPMLPQVIGEAVIGAANLAINALEKMINAQIAGLNTVASYVNNIFGTNLAPIAKVDLGEIKNVYSGAGKAAAGAFTSAVGKAYGEAQSGLSKIGGDIGNSIFKAMKTRVSGEADKLIDDRKAGAAGRKAGKTAGDKFMEAFMASAKDLNALIARNLARDFDKMTGSVAAAMDKIDAANDNAFSQQLAQDNAERTRGLVEAIDATNAWNEQLSQTIDYLGQIGDLAGSVGEIAAVFQGLASGNLTNLPGRAGAFIGLLNQSDGGRELLDGFRDILDDTFGGNGTFLKAIQGAGTGAAVGSVFFGGSQGGQIGALLGGSIGQTFAKDLGSIAGNLMGKTLGKVFEAAVPVLGSIAGGLIGKLFKSGPDWATTNLASGASGGNKDAQRSGVGQAVGAFDDSLKKIASALGASVGAFNTSLGLHNGNWHVSTDGRTGVLRSSQANVTDFKGDAEAALKFAIRDAIVDGGLLGLETWKKTLILAGEDLEAQLQKVLSLQGVFDELEQLKDPQAFDLKGLEKWRTDMLAIATDAGTGMAEIEELYGLKRAEIAEKYSKEIASVEDKRALQIQILELEGNTIAALTMARQAEKDAADASLHSLLDRRNALQDEAQAAQEAAAASDRILALQARLARAQGDEQTARAIEHMQEMAGARTAEERAMLEQLYAIDKLVDTQKGATAAYEMQANAMAQVIDKMREASAGLREFANELFGKNTIGDTEAMRRQVLKTMELAGAGDSAAIAKLPDLINSYLPNALKSAGSMTDYLREVSLFGQGTRDIADINDSRANLNSAYMQSWFSGRDVDPEVMNELLAQLASKMDDLKDTIASGNDRQLAATNEQTGYVKKTAKYTGISTNGGANT